MVKEISGREKLGEAEGIADFQIGEHIDCIDTQESWRNAEVLTKKAYNGEWWIRIHFTGFSNEFNEWLQITSPRLQRQWEQGMELRINHRIDVLDPYSKWLEGIIIEVANTIIKVHYKGFAMKYDEWIERDSPRIQEVGSNSSAYGKATFHTTSTNRLPKTYKIESSLSQPTPDNYHSSQYTNSTGEERKENMHHKLFNERLEKLKERERIIIQENNFKRILGEKKMGVKEVMGDGNCLFRAVSDQVFGTEEFHSQIREVCMAYMRIERDFFKQFVVGGDEYFDRYVEYKSLEGIWGDDLEIQILSEIYNRPIQLFAYSGIPMRTFHEVLDPNSRVQPIRLSYHGQSHYNSIVKLDTERINYPEFGSIEKEALKRAEERMGEEREEREQKADAKLAPMDVRAIEEIKEESKGIEESKELAHSPGCSKNEKSGEYSIAEARAQFEKEGVRNMDTALVETLDPVTQANPVQTKAMEDVLKESLIQYQNTANENQLLKFAIDSSIHDQESKDQLVLDKVMEDSKNEYLVGGMISQIQNISPNIRSVMEAGFSLEQATMGMSIVGDNPDMIIAYLLDQYSL